MLTVVFFGVHEKNISSQKIGAHFFGGCFFECFSTVSDDICRLIYPPVILAVNPPYMSIMSWTTMGLPEGRSYGKNFMVAPKLLHFLEVLPSKGWWQKRGAHGCPHRICHV
jgi:hypothetical protein